MKFSEIESGRAVRVKNFTSLPPAMRQQLMQMGFMPSRSLTIVRRAPLGDPLQVQILNSTVAMQKKFASQLLVEDI